MTRKMMLGLVAVTTALVVGISTARAYVLPANALMERANSARRRLAIRSLELQGEVERDGVRTQLWEALRTDARRRELRRGDDTKVVLTRGAQRFEFSPGSGPVRPVRAPMDLLIELGFPTEPDEEGARASGLLRSLGINPQVVSLGRQDRRIVYVIGARAQETNRPQLWLDKELMVPVRLVVFGRDRVRRETRWLGFGSPLTSPYFPRRIETWVDGKLVEAVTYDDIKVNPRLANALFEPPT